MTLKVGRLSEPRLITDDLLEALQQVGELSISEIEQIADRYSQSSYEDEIRALCELTGICFDIDNVLSLRNDILLRIDDEAERRFRFLTRMPHFRKWLQLQMGDTPGLWHTEAVNTVDERKVSRIGDFRESRFQSWADQLDDDLQEQSLQERVATGFDLPCRVTDECLFYDTKGKGPDQNQVKRMAFLLVLLGGKAHGDGVKLSQLSTTFECSVDTLQEWTTAYLDPVGCPVQIVDDTAWLMSPVTYESHRFDSIEQLLLHAGLAEKDILVGTSIVDTILSTFDAAFTCPPEQSVQQGNVSIMFHSYSADTALDGDSYQSVEDLVEDVQDRNPPTHGYHLTGPSISSEALRRPVQNAVHDFLDFPDNADDVSAESWELASLLRERYRFIGGLPLIHPGSSTELTAFGEHLKATDPDLPTLRCLFFSTNPWIRYLTVLSGMNHVSVRKEKDTWKACRDDYTAPLSDALHRAIATSPWVDTVLPSDHMDVDTSQLVRFAVKLGIVERDPATQRLDLPTDVAAELSEHDLLNWHDKIEHTLRQTKLSHPTQ